MSVGSGPKRGSFVHGLELRRQGSQLMMEGRKNSAASRSQEPGTPGILQQKKSQNQLNNEALKEDMEGSSKKVDFQRGMDYSESYTKLCRLLVEGVKMAIKDVFDRFFPPIILQDKLSNPNMYKRLEFLVTKGVIDDKQWTKLYPKTRQRASSSHYDTMLLLVILKHVCRLPPPYPDGWYAPPREADESISALLARLGLLRKEAVHHPDMSEEESARLWETTLLVLMKLNDDILQTAEKIAAEPLDEEVRYVYVKRLYAMQDKEVDIMEKEEQMKKRKDTNDVVMASLNLDASPEPPSFGSLSPRRPSTVSTSSPQHQLSRRASSAYIVSTKAQGMPKEERHTLLTFYKSLVTHIKAPEIMEQLIKAEIFNAEDKMTVFLSDKNRERMDALLRILLTKPAAAYTEFCKPIKFKHAHLFELMNKTYNTLKRQAAFRKPDGLTHTMEHMQPYCTKLLTKWKPIHWSGAKSTTVREHYTDLQLVTQDGRYIEIKDMVDNSQDRCKILIEGVSGCGKSSLCLSILYGWLTGSVDWLREYSLLFLIDCRREKDLQKAVFSQMTSEYQFDKDELWHIVEEHQTRIMFILDGVENAEGDCVSLVSNELLPHCGLIVTNRSGVEMTSQFTVKLNLTGLDKYHVGEFISKYMELTNCGPEDFGGFYHKLNDCDEEYQVFVLNPFLCSCLCAMRSNKTNCDVITETELLEQFLQAMIRSQSGKKLEYYDFINDGVTKLQALAFQASMAKRSKIDKHEVERKCGRDIMKLGLLVSFSGSCAFINSTIQDFLTARHIRTIKSGAENTVSDDLQLKTVSEDIFRFLCGMHETVANQSILKRLVEDMGEENLQMHRAVRFQSENEAILRGMYTSRVTELSLSLQCVHESQGCPWIAGLIAKSLPTRLVLRSGTISQNALLGLADILRLGLEGVTELDIFISEEMNIRRYGLLKIAESLRSNDNVQYLRLEWTSNDLFSKFLCESFTGGTKIHSVKMVDRSRRSHDMTQNALVHAQLLHGFKRMTQVQNVTFQDCQNPAILVSIIRNCNRKLQSLDLTGCQMNIVSVKELSTLLEYTTALKSLNLTDVRLNGTIFSHFARGLKVTKTLQELILCHCGLDQMGELLLAESLQFNHSLRRLDISKNKLSMTGCRLLAESMNMNAGLNELIILRSHLKEACLKVFERVRRPEFRLVDDCHRPKTAIIHAD